MSKKRIQSIGRLTNRTLSSSRRGMFTFSEPLEARRLLTVALDTNTHQLSVLGTAGADTITVTRTGANIVITNPAEPVTQTYLASDVTSINIAGQDGDDVIRIDQAITVGATIRGNNGNDSIVGGGGADTIDGGSGDDTLDGGGGGDFLFGNTGLDTADYSNRTVDLNISLDGLDDDGAAGEQDNVDSTCDTILCGTGNDRVSNNLNNDIRAFYGRDGNDTLIGGNSSDRLNGGRGNDSLRGNDGDDTLLSSGGDDTMAGGDGTDVVTFYFTNSTVHASLDGKYNDGVGNDHANIRTDVEMIIGGGGNDVLVGSDAANTINGGSGDDRITGLGGADALYGSGGKDSIDGGVGNDTIYGGTADDSLTGGIDNDSIFGEAGNDHIIAKDGFADILDGGAGTSDSATSDLGIDTLSNIP